MTLSNEDRWRETADVATRMQYPDEYWCIADDGGHNIFWAEQTVNFWAEQTVSREEYLANVF